MALRGRHARSAWPVLHAAIETMLYKHAPGFTTGEEHTLGQYKATTGAAAPLRR